MDNNETKRIRTCKVKKWTNASIDCYERQCNCEGCYYYEYLDSKCEMKNSVIKLVKKFGAPEKRIREFKGDEYFHESKLNKEDLG